MKDRTWVPYYASLCFGCWILAIVDVLNLVAYEFITASEWIFVFLLMYSLRIVFHLKDDITVKDTGLRTTGIR